MLIAIPLKIIGFVFKGLFKSIAVSSEFKDIVSQAKKLFVLSHSAKKLFWLGLLPF
jgi:hypothetical protein